MLQLQFILRQLSNCIQLPYKGLTLKNLFRLKESLQNCKHLSEISRSFSIEIIIIFRKVHSDILIFQQVIVHYFNFVIVYLGVISLELSFLINERIL